MKILVYVEGASDRVVLEPLVRSAVGKAHGVKFFPVKGKDELLQRVPATARLHLEQNHQDWIFVIPDLYPARIEGPERLRHRTAGQLRAVLRREFGKSPALPRFRPHVLVHDLEVLLLAAPGGLRKALRTQESLKWRLPPETQNGDEPPKYIVQKLFQKYLKRSYNEIGDAERVLRGVAPADLAGSCPEGFGRFWRELGQVVRGEALEEAE